MSDPLVSIIIPSFNRAAFLPAALESVLAQDYAAKEIIVVDDGSAGGTAEVCARFPVVYLRQENRGPSAARNHGAGRCRGELLVFLDDDDLFPPGSLQLRVDHWRHDPGCRHVIGKLRRFTGEPGGPLGFVDSGDQARHDFCPGAELIERSAFEQMGGYDESLRMSEDVDLCLRIRGAGLRQKLIPETCLFYRRHAGNATHDLDDTKRNFLSVLHTTMQRRREQSSTTKK